VTFAFIAKHRGIWPAGWLCEALGVSRAGFYAWRTRPPSVRARADEQFLIRVRASFLTSDRTYGARRVWHDVLVEGLACGRHRIERLMRHAALRARPRRRRMPSDTGVRSTHALAPNVLNRTFDAASANRKWVADFTYLWTAEGWLYVAAVMDLFSRRVVGWSMSTTMTAQLVTDALVMAICWLASSSLRMVLLFLVRPCPGKVVGKGPIRPRNKRAQDESRRGRSPHRSGHTLSALVRRWLRCQRVMHRRSSSWIPPLHPLAGTRKN
jgi:putative transposase